ncbi:MAG TPA: hypothetical protein VKZ98_02840 [Aquaticitalea sp.]|nr:hypothetical protein [Aquaticitalea sp.]
MAKIIKRSILGTIQGKIGGVSVYNIKNVGAVLRKSGGPSKEQMETNPNFRVTLKNQKEFGGCATASAALRKGLVVAKEFQNGDYSGALVGKLRLVAQSGQGELGRRDIHLCNAPQHLLNLEIRKDNLFARTYQAPITVKLNPTRTAIHINIPRTGAEDHIKLSKHVTHFQLTMAVSLVSTYRFNTEIDKYEPANVLQNAIGTSTQSIPLEVNRVHKDILLIAPIPTGIPLAQDVSASVWLGITYGRGERGQYEDMAVNKSMQCVAVF